MIIGATAFTVFKLIDYTNFEKGKDADETQSDNVDNYTKILSTIVVLAFVGKIQHLLKIFPELGRLSELIFMSIVRVIPFFAIFILWNMMFAM
tara:strand:+ start:432 stop:710 length:279 start_codon:yes stop_codon:yes gene_type:complete